MKAFVLALLAVSLPFIASQDENCNFRKFLEFKYKNGKTYTCAEDEYQRCVIFTQTLAQIEAHNRLYEANLVTYKQGINKFTDMTKEEFLAKFTGIGAPPDDHSSEEQHMRVKRAGPTGLVAPANWTADTANFTNPFIPIKDQMGCGGCWAFAATGVYEYYVRRKFSRNVDISEQMCIDCARPVGCSGGWMHECFNYYLNKGANFEKVYPYTNAETAGTCAYKPTTDPANGLPKTQAFNWYTVGADERQLAYVISQVGWVAASVNADLLMSYESGIVPAAGCPTTPNHAVIFTGYGKDPATGMEYWIARNSWNTWWGESGRFRIQRNKNACGIASSYPYYRVHLM